MRALKREGREWVDAELRHAGYAIRHADVAAGIHSQLLYRFVLQPGARVELLPAVYRLERGDMLDAAHLLNEPRGDEPLKTTTNHTCSFNARW